MFDSNSFHIAQVSILYEMTDLALSFNNFVFDHKLSSLINYWRIKLWINNINQSYVKQNFCSTFRFWTPNIGATWKGKVFDHCIDIILLSQWTTLNFAYIPDVICRAAGEILISSSNQILRAKCRCNMNAMELHATLKFDWHAWIQKNMIFSLTFCCISLFLVTTNAILLCYTTNATLHSACCSGKQSFMFYWTSWWLARSLVHSTKPRGTLLRNSDDNFDAEAFMFSSFHSINYHCYLKKFPFQVIYSED